MRFAGLEAALLCVWAVPAGAVTTITRTYDSQISPNTLTPLTPEEQYRVSSVDVTGLYSFSGLSNYSFASAGGPATGLFTVTGGAGSLLGLSGTSSRTENITIPQSQVVNLTDAFGFRTFNTITDMQARSYAAATTIFPSYASSATYQLLTGAWSVQKTSLGHISSHTQLTFVYTLADSPVPEPATWAMMIVGFFGIGAALRGHASTKLSLMPFAATKFGS